MKMILGTEFITIHCMSLLLFIINELMCDHGFKKPAGGSLPLVLGCRTGPCLFTGVTVFPAFILRSICV